MTADSIFDGYVNTRRIKKLVSERRATRQRIIDEENRRIDDLRENLESGVWVMDKLDALEVVIKEKKARMTEDKELAITDKDVDI